MDTAAAAALQTDKVIDITTTGRTSGDPRRIEIWFHHLEGRTFITGRPGRRSWYANLRAQPRFTFHLKGSHHADLSATSRPILDETERRQLLAPIVAGLNADQPPLDAWVDGAPLVEVIFD
ncbi:MAG: nitroreductase/quinone reductase family protein [Chloroflexi bacterium]|nr:nitroreductase/quinone reductase family protein [Chloroflexota bacterium]MDA1145968.1 nitroreductase/quinone reductase family protein [Chloroflexota bacterium]